MSRKDFELIAYAIRRVLEDRGDPMDAEALVAEFGRVLAGTNPRFNRDRFERACGLKARS
jgi:hypothetical protein